MDLLIKNNIIKQNRVIVDIGTFRTKVLEVKYEARNIYITSASSFDTSVGGVISFAEIARRVRSVTSGAGQKNVVIILPGAYTENKIISMKNIKESDIDKAIEKEGFAKASPATHEIDYAYLGKRDEQGDTIRYCLMAAAAKSIDNELVSEFLTCGLKVISVVSSIYAQINLSELFYDEYEHPNRLMVDFGKSSMRIAAISDGVAVYSRLIGLGRSSYEDEIFRAQQSAGKPEICEALEKIGCKPLLTAHSKYFDTLDEMLYFDIVKRVNANILNELSRIADLCETNGITITKIFLTGRPIFGFEQAVKDKMKIECSVIDFRGIMEKEGRDFVVCFEPDIDREYANAVGIAVNPFI
ncbi:MAG: pilus assembly protein PilM [Clostridiales bacterium]|nr:pilus assembly protein PilM [Clostridiales bacterium]